MKNTDKTILVVIFMNSNKLITQGYEKREDKNQKTPNEDPEKAGSDKEEPILKTRYINKNN